MKKASSSNQSHARESIRFKNRNTAWDVLYKDWTMRSKFWQLQIHKFVLNLIEISWWTVHASKSLRRFTYTYMELTIWRLLPRSYRFPSIFQLRCGQGFLAHFGKRREDDNYWVFKLVYFFEPIFDNLFMNMFWWMRLTQTVRVFCWVATVGVPRVTIQWLVSKS